MTASMAYVTISVGALAVIGVLLFLMRGKVREYKITPLAGLAFGFVLAGIVFGQGRLVGYGLMGVGVILAVADIFNRARSR